jgi:hypothetical protein
VLAVVGVSPWIRSAIRRARAAQQPASELDPVLEPAA